MTSSQIRCLLAVLALSEAYAQIESKNVAHLLGVKRPTVFRALETLQAQGLIEKEHYGDVHLTEEGLAQAKELEACRDDLALVFACQHGLSPEESSKAAILLMGELKQKSLQQMRKRPTSE